MMSRQAGPPPPMAPAPGAQPESAGAPGFKAGDQIDSQRCFACRNWDGEARCQKFGNAADAMDTCDGFEMGEEGGEGATPNPQEEIAEGATK